MKWSVNSAWAIGVFCLGIWHPMQPPVGDTGHEVFAVCSAAPPLRGCSLAIAPPAWHSRQRDSYQAADFSTSRCGSWHVAQSSALPLSE